MFLPIWYSVWRNLVSSRLGHWSCLLNTLRPRQNGRHFADDPFKRIFLNENVWISRKISLKFVARVRINNIPALVPIMAWRRSGDKPLSKPIMVSLLTHICVTRPQWVNQASAFPHIGYRHVCRSWSFAAIHQATPSSLHWKETKSHLWLPLDFQHKFYSGCSV